MRARQAAKGGALLIDALLILLLAAGIVGLAARADKSRKAQAQERACIVAVIEGISAPALNALREGDRLTLGDRTELGTLISVESRAHTAVFTAPDGARKELPLEGKYDLILTLEAHGSFGADGFLLNARTHIAPNQRIEFTTRIVESSLKIAEIKKFPEQ